MKKKLLALFGIIVAVVCAALLFGCTRRPDETVRDGSGDGVIYRLEDDGSAYFVSGTFGSLAEIKIRSECNGLPVTRIGQAAFNTNETITSIELPGSITRIDYRAFRGCRKLRDIEIPDGVTEIGDEAFQDCVALISVKLPSGLEAISTRMFDGCTALLEVDIPKSVTRVGAYAFDGCVELTSLEIPEGVQALQTGVLQYCTSLKRLVLPSTITTMSMGALDGCESIKEATVPAMVIELLPRSLHKITINGGKPSSRALNGFDSLTEVTITSGVETISNGAIPFVRGLIVYCEAEERPTYWASAWCDSQLPVIWNCKNNDRDENGYAYSVINGISYRLGGGEATVWGNQPVELAGNIVIPDSVIYKDSEYAVTAVDDEVFTGNLFITSVTFPFGLKTIGEFAFNLCSALRSVTLHDGLTEIGRRAFCGCSALTEIELPRTLNSIGISAFADCSGLTSIEVPRGVTVIDGGLFSGCTRLSRVVLPDTVTTIVTGAFSGCARLTQISLPDSVTGIGNQAFSGCVGLTCVKLPSALTDIGSYAFQNCENLTGIIMHGGVTNIESYAFDGTQLSEVYFIGTTASTSRYSRAITTNTENLRFTTTARRNRRQAETIGTTARTGRRLRSGELLNPRCD